MTASSFHPNWASPPGDTIRDLLIERELSVTGFSELIQEPLSETEELLAGQAPITVGLARTLSEVLGSTVEFWMARDIVYRDDSIRIENEDWISELPIDEMIQFGWFDVGPDSADQIRACLRFFDVPDARTWSDQHQWVLSTAAFRTSSSFTSDDGALAAWLRKGEIEANSIACGSWDVAGFKLALIEARRLTRQSDPVRFIPELRQMFAEHGVAVAIVRAPSRCRASGATRFLTDDKALLMLSFRYLTDDHFWFTVFHEAAHLILHGQDDLFLEGHDALKDSAETEANAFASSVLIPPEFGSEMESLRSAKGVMRFARDIGVSPGIVVGQLQHSGRIPNGWLNKLKRRYKWGEVSPVTIGTAHTDRDPSASCT